MWWFRLKQSWIHWRMVSRVSVAKNSRMAQQNQIAAAPIHTPRLSWVHLVSQWVNFVRNEWPHNVSNMSLTEYFSVLKYGKMFRWILQNGSGGSRKTLQPIFYQKLSRSKEHKVSDSSLLLFTIPVEVWTMTIVQRWSTRRRTGYRKTFHSPAFTVTVAPMRRTALQEPATDYKKRIIKSASATPNPLNPELTIIMALSALAPSFSGKDVSTWKCGYVCWTVPWIKQELGNVDASRLFNKTFKEAHDNQGLRQKVTWGHGVYQMNGWKPAPLDPADISLDESLDPKKSNHGKRNAQLLLA